MENARLNGPRAPQPRPPPYAYAADVLHQRAKLLLDRIQPNPESIRRRDQLFHHISDLIRTCFASYQVSVFTFGSVPLKTYLPDGDIDVTIYVPDHQSLPDDWAPTLKDFLEQHADRNPHAIIRGISIIKAEVELLKCLIDNVIVDISYRQVGGLRTVSFLEDMDRHVDEALLALQRREGTGAANRPDPTRPYLFKRSIILVKAYCYYEARLLGAHHSLLSTYALEVLVLYVINNYHDKARSPLAVLHIFLRTFGDFDWEKYAISLHGPVPLAAVCKTPNMSALPPRFVLSSIAQARRVLELGTK